MTSPSPTPTQLSRRATHVILGLLLIMSGFSIWKIGWNVQHPHKPQRDRFEMPTMYISEAQKAEMLSEAKGLRAKWQGWAQAHSEPLHKMLHAPKTDLATLQSVYALLPSTSDLKKSGITPEDLEAGETLFAWRITSQLELAQGKEQEVAPAKRNMLNFRLATIIGTFTKYHDIEIVRSFFSGPMQYTLCASGRILATTYSLRDGSETTKELVPPYDFLH